MRATESPAAAKKSGNRPQARPSLRLLTRPAWLHDESACSLKLVRTKISPGGEPAVAVRRRGDVVAASWRAWPRVSRTNRVESPRPSPANATPRKNGSGRSPYCCGDEAGRERGERDRAVAGGFVEAHREAAPGGADEVDLHDDRGRPGQSLVDAEQHVGEDDPAPSSAPTSTATGRARRRSSRRRGRVCVRRGPRGCRRRSWSRPSPRRTRR